MKKRYLAIIGVIVIGISLFFIFSYFKKADIQSHFNVEKNSDFYIVSSKSIGSYNLDNGKIKELNKTPAKMPDVLISDFVKGEFENRYLVISSGDGSDFTDDERMISITAVTQFTGKNGKLYLTEGEQSKKDEKNLNLLSTELLDDNPEKVYFLTSSTVVGNYLYASISEIRDRTTYERTPSNDFLAYNLETKKKEFFTLNLYKQE